MILADEDALAYKQVIKTKGEQKAVMQAAEVPLQTARKSLSILKMAYYLAKHGNQNLVSDAHVAVELAQAAIFGALENVRVNLPTIKNEKERQRLKNEIDAVVDKVKELV